MSLTDADIRRIDREHAEMEAAHQFSDAVAHEAHRIRVREAARAKVQAERAGDAPAFDAGTLAEILGRPPEPVHRVEDLIPAEASVLLSAQKKSGKTTWLLNLARCLVTGEDLLGRFGVRPVAGNVAILNYEVSGGMLARWGRDAGVPQERLFVVNLRGRRNPLAVPEDRARLAAVLRSHDVESLLVDPFGRAFSGRSQNDAAEVTPWLVDLEAFARSEVGVRDLVLSAHAGWAGERTRGSSALEDWPDVIVTMTRDKEDASKRYLSAEGRDVLVEEDRLTYNAATRTLVLAGTGSRRQDAAAEKISELVSVVIAIVTDHPGITTGNLEDAIRRAGHGFQRGDVGKAGRRATASGHLRQEHGPRNSVLWYPVTAECSRVLPTTPAGSVGVVPSPPYRGRTTPVPTDSPVLPEPEGEES